MPGPVTGFIGLGNMGHALASNLVASGFDLVVFDVAGKERAPEGSRFVESAEDVARSADVIVLSLPDGDISGSVARAIAAADARRTRDVIDTSTVGVPASQAIAAALAEHGVDYVDAPVSGGPAGARARTLTVMYAGPDDACARVEPVLAGLSDRRRRVGARAGLGQAMKLANNFLSATALAATSEAIAFGLSVGLEMADMLEVLATSSGQNMAVSDKFPNHVLTGRYASGFSNVLMSKDLQLYLQAVREAGGGDGSPAAVGALTASIWKDFAEQEPGADFTRIYLHVADA